MLQDDLDVSATLLAAQVTIFATTALLKRLLIIQLCMEKQEYLTMGVHTFTLGKHAIAVWQALADCAARYALVI